MTTMWLKNLRSMKCRPCPSCPWCRHRRVQIPSLSVCPHPPRVRLSAARLLLASHLLAASLRFPLGWKGRDLEQSVKCAHPSAYPNSSSSFCGSLSASSSGSGLSSAGGVSSLKMKKNNIVEKFGRKRTSWHRFSAPPRPVGHHFHRSSSRSTGGTRAHRGQPPAQPAESKWAYYIAHRHRCRSSRSSLCRLPVTHRAHRWAAELTTTAVDGQTVLCWRFSCVWLVRGSASEKGKWEKLRQKSVKGNRRKAHKKFLQQHFARFVWLTVEESENDDKISHLNTNFDCKIFW